MTMLWVFHSCQKEIDSFYGKYARKEGISLAEAKKRVSNLDVKAFERKAAKYVKDKDFSKKANEELRLYNATMKINRLEMLKANIGLEMIAGHDELEKFMGKILKGRTMEELQRQAGILGKTVRNNAKAANAIVNGSFKNGTFSERIWQYQDQMRQDLGGLLQTGLIQGKNPRAIAGDLRKYWFGNDPRTGGGAEYCMERLMRTELARVQTEAQKQSFERNGFEEYTFHANSGCCDDCQSKDGKPFKVKDMMPGLNAAPLHPNCRCSVSAYEDSAEYEAWLDYLDKGGTTEEWNRSGKAKWLKSQKALENSDNSSIIKSKNYLQPNIQLFAKIPTEKLTKYALDPSKDPNKAKAFKEALGYTLENHEDLIANIYAHIDEGKFVEKGDSGYGMKYEYIMSITGPNGKTANVLTAWIQDGKDKRLTSIYVTERGLTE